MSQGLEPKQEAVWIGSLDSAVRKKLLTTSYSVLYAEPGYLLYVTEGKLMAHRFDMKKLELDGDPTVVATNVQIQKGASGYAAFSASHNGVLAYQQATGAVTQLVWFDRNGTRLSAAGPPGDYDELSLSPNGMRVALNRRNPDSGSEDIWLIELSGGRLSRLTFHTGDRTPVWHPDGSRIAFASPREGRLDLYMKTSTGAGREVALLSSAQSKWPSDFSPDGRILIFEADDPSTKLDLWMLPVFEDGKPQLFLQTQFNESQGEISPDGRWIAYTSDETGQPEVYVQTFPSLSGKWQISNRGGSQPAWRNDCKELYYLDSEQRLVAVPLKLEPNLEPDSPRPLFETTMQRADLGWNKQYVPSPDGQRFLINTQGQDSNASLIAVVLNWTSPLQK